MLSPAVPRMGLALILTGVATACPSPPDPASAPVYEPDGLDVDAVVAQLQHSFIRRGDRHWASNANMRVEATPEGEVRIHLDGGDRSEQPSVPLSIKTLRVARDGHELDAPSGTTTDRSGALVLDRGSARERIAMHVEGVEQSWAFDAAPLGRGDLRVELEAGGYDYAGSSPQGHHFAADDPQRAAVYGPATWIDAEGDRTSLITEHEDGRLVITVPAEVVDGSAYPALLDPMITPETSVDDTALGPVPWSNHDPRVASDGDRLLVVWRNSPDPYNPVTPLLGALVDPLGGPVHPGSFTIGAETGEFPDVAFSGSQYVVAWIDGPGTLASHPVRVARIAVDGTILDPAGLVAGEGFGAIGARIACATGRCLVTWRDDLELRGRVFDDDGFFPIEPFTISEGPTSLQPAVVAVGTGFYVAWREGDALLGTRVDESGDLLDVAPVELGDRGIVSPALATDGARVLAVWGGGSATELDLVVRLVDVDTGVPLGTGPTRISSDDTSLGTTVTATFDGTAYVAAWYSSTRLRARRVSAAGTPLGASPTTVATSLDNGIQFPDLEDVGDELYLVWDNVFDPAHDANAAQIFGSRLSSVLARKDPDTLISTAPTAGIQARPAIAWGNDRYLVTWQDRRTGSWDIYAAFVDRSGASLDAAFTISSAPGDQLEPAIDYSGVRWLVTWADARNGAGNYDIYGARVLPDGNVQDPFGIAISSAAGSQRRPKVAYDGSRFVTVWEEDKLAADIRGARVSVSGTVADPGGFAIDASTSVDRAPDIAAGDGLSYVVWNRQISGSAWQVRGTAVSLTGVVDVPNGRSLIGASNTQRDPAIASHGANEFMMVWAELGQIRGRIVDEEGDFLGNAFDVSAPGVNALDPDITSDSERFLVVWQAGPQNLAGAIVEDDGAMFDGPFTLAATPWAEEHVTAAAAAPGYFLTAYRDARTGTLVRMRALGNTCCTTSTDGGCLDASVEACVCATDDFCCDNHWDALCVDEVESLACGSCPPPACCTAVAAPGCADPEIEACVCEADAFCCATAWDALCVAEVGSFGCGQCW